MFDWLRSHSYKSRKDSGKYNFFVKHQPQHIDSSTTLTLTTYTNSSQSATIPCRYKWSIIKNGLTIQVPQFKGSSFKCQPSDIGSLIQAEVISNDNEYNGVAVIQFGPVKLDVTLKKQVEQALATGSVTMAVYLMNSNQEKQCQIRLFEDVIKINHAHSENNYTFDYSMFEPRIQCVSKDSSRIIIIFNEKYQSQLKRFTKKLFQQPYSSNSNISSSSHSNQSTSSSSTHQLSIRFSTRTSRDIFLFSLKAFNTKKQLRSSIIINKIQKIDFSNPQTFDYILQIQNLKSQLIKMDQIVKKAYQQKFKYYNEINKLEKQIEEIIVTYTRIVQEKFMNQAELSRDYSMLSQKRDEILSKKYRNLQNQNNHLNSRIQTLAKQIDNIRFKPTPTISAPLVNIGNQNSNIINPTLNQPQKIYFNYQLQQQQQYYNTAFTKKKSIQNNDISGIANILDQLGQSRISHSGSSNNNKQQQQLRLKLDQVQHQNSQLQKKLQKSFHKIDSLQKQLFIQKQQSKNSSQILIYQQQQHNQNNNNFNNNNNNNNNINNKLNNSAVHFTYNHQISSMQQINFASNYQHHVSAIVNIDRQKESLLYENNQLKKNNQQLLIEKKILIEELKKPINTGNNKDNLNGTRNYNNQQNKINHINNNNNYDDMNYLKTHKKQLISSSSDRQKQLIQTIKKRQDYINLLKLQNQQLKRSNQQLKKSLQSSKQSTNYDTQKFVKRINQLQQQIQMYRKNTDALNRSQHLSMQMDNYNQQQIQMLKQHNQFLTLQNQKLAKACEKYMADAKETNKLRMEIIKLKEKINQIQMMDRSGLGLGVGVV